MLKKRAIFISIWLIVFILGGCNSTLRNSTDSLKDDEKIILRYLDTKTNDISGSADGRRYSVYSILGTDKDKIYLWVHQEDCLKKDNKAIMTNSTSLPVVLYITTREGKIQINNHKYPEDGENYGESLGRLFPDNILKRLKEVDGNEGNNEQLKRNLRNRVQKDMVNCKVVEE